MCCVDAPSFQGKYDKGNFDMLDTLISALRPNRILVQGGEILAQPDSINWLARLRQGMPNLGMEMVTNGNNIKQIGYVTDTFDRITVSFVGFQPATYKVIMGMNVEMTKRFCVEVIASGKVRVYLKYLITPNNLHELPMFLEWAIGLARK
jgi:pyruvate-formate lyase-activating enzyme